MLLGKVVGTLVATRKEPRLEGLKFLVLRQLDIHGQASRRLSGGGRRRGRRPGRGGAVRHRQLGPP